MPPPLLQDPATPKPLSLDFRPNTKSPFLTRLYHIIFEAESPAGRGFDVALIVVIVASVAVVMLESVTYVRLQYATLLRTAEWVFTVLFTAEYLLRLAVVDRPVKYAKSFFGVVDVLAILPTYLSLLIPGAQFLLAIRLLRILRVFRVLKLVKYLEDADVLVTALQQSRRKIYLFMFAVLNLTVVLGSLMYFIEGEEHGFTSIPRSVYWAIVTLTTVGYGDISPQTNMGQFLASAIMIVGYGIIAVPTGIVTAELTHETARRAKDRTRTACSRCGLDQHPIDARYCHRCSERIVP